MHQRIDTLHGLLDALGLHRLQDVIESVGIEGFDREFIVRGSEDNQRREGHVPEHFKAIHGRHFDIEKHNIGMQFFDLLESFRPIRRSAHQ